MGKISVKIITLIFLSAPFGFSQIWLKLTDEHFDMDDDRTPSDVIRDVTIRFQDAKDDFPQKVLSLIQQKKIDAKMVDIKAEKLTNKKWKAKKELKTLGLQNPNTEKWLDYSWALFVSSDLKQAKFYLGNEKNRTAFVFPFEQIPQQAIKWVRDYSFDASQDPWTCFSYYSDSGFVFPSEPKIHSKKENVRFIMPKELNFNNHVESFVTKETFDSKENASLFQAFLPQIWNKVVKNELKLYYPNSTVQRPRSEFWHALKTHPVAPENLDSNNVQMDFSFGLSDVMLSGDFMYQNGKPVYQADKLFFIWDNPNMKSKTEALGFIHLKDLPENQRNILNEKFNLGTIYAYLVRLNDKPLMSLEESHAIQDFLISGAWDKILPQKTFYLTYLKK